MVGYTQFSRDAASAERTKLWDPSKTLGIINADPGYQCITCVGYAPTQRRRCRIAIRMDNREFITQTLNDISYMDPDSPTVISRLREIAGPALCVRYHQNQAETVVMQWQNKIQQLKAQLGDQKSTKPTQSSKKKESVQDQTVEDLKEQLREMREILAKLREEVDSQRHQDQGHEQREEQAEKDRQEERRRRRSEERDREARKQEKERLKKERLEKERLEEERLEKERLENERREKEKKREKREREQKEKREREEKEKRERERKEREEWDQLWTKYQERWVHFRASGSREGDLQNAIPWPVKSGLRRDLKSSNVKEFLKMAVPRDASMARLMRKECQKWHPDTINSWLRGSQLSEVNNIAVGMICRVVTDLLNESAGRSNEFLG